MILDVGVVLKDFRRGGGVNYGFWAVSGLVGKDEENQPHFCVTYTYFGVDDA